MSWISNLTMGPLHASIWGHGLRRLVSATDALLRRIYGIKRFESAEDGLLLIAFRRVEYDVTLSDGTGLRPGDTVIELHIWNEHFPRFPAKISDLGWAPRLRGQMRCSLHRLARHIKQDRNLAAVRALRINLAIPNRRRSNALANLLKTAGFEPAPNVTRKHGALFRSFDNLWVWLLTWTYNPKALIGSRFNTARHEFWISRSRFLMLHANYFESHARLVDRPGLDLDQGGRMGNRNRLLDR